MGLTTTNVILLAVFIVCFIIFVVITQTGWAFNFSDTKDDEDAYVPDLKT